MGELVDPMGSVRAYLAAEKSPNTRRAYQSDWRDFTTWCEAAGLSALPAVPPTVARYLSHLADRKLAASTITRRACAIRFAHKAANFEPPTSAEGVKATMRGIRRTLGTAPKRQVEPAVAAAIATMIKELPDSLTGVRDRAILLLGFAAARRRSELAALHRNDVELHKEGLSLHVRRSKTDQEGRGRIIHIPRGEILKPVAAVEAWLEASGITEGPLFRPIDRWDNLGAEAITGRSIARVVKHAAALSGLDEKIFSGHSMRAGFVTEALDREVDGLKIMDITGHVDPKTLKIYDRRKRTFKNHAGKDFL